MGYDCHRLVQGRVLVLGGVTIPHSHGLDGHSDADVLTHALCDAILGACGLGDIGIHFPDTDPTYKGISSITLLERVIEKAEGMGMKIGNADITLVAQAPRMSPYVKEMKRILADVCKIPPERINIKATTTEGLGFIGSRQGISAYAVCLLIPVHAS